MTDFQAEFENFILWFVGQEDLDLEARRDFMEHILAVGTIDEKAEQYISKSVEMLRNISQQRADEMEQKVQSLQAAIAGEKDPEQSLTENIIRTEGAAMMDEARRFREQLQAAKQQKLDAAESSEQDAESAEVATIKAEL